MALDERAAGILLRLLAALGMLTPLHQRFQLSGEARLYLLKSSPFYWGHMMRRGVNSSHLDTLMARLRQVGSSLAGPPEDKPNASGKGRAVDAWASGQISAGQASDIAARMHSHSLPAAIGASLTYDLSGVRRLLDVGGGSGCFAIALAQRNPLLRATIMELPAMCDVARAYIESGNVADRVDTIPVDMFRQDWPQGYDAVFFSNVWHDWSFKTCRWLGRRAWESLPPGGRILLHEMLIDEDGAGPATAAAFSMMMLLATEGQQFTLGELTGLLEVSGFSGIETRQTYGYYSITSGLKR
jgi:acetylserotonin N-methyltransferase